MWSRVGRTPFSSDLHRAHHLTGAAMIETQGASVEDILDKAFISHGASKDS